MAETAKDIKDTPTPVLPVAEKNPDMVEITITKFGDGKVSTGVHVAPTGDIFAKRGDKMVVSETIARHLEAIGVAETN